MQRNLLLKSIFSALIGVGCLVSNGVMAFDINEDVSMSGLVEAEAGYSTNASDIVTATVELGIDAKINDRVSSSVVFLHEEDSDAAFGVDVAVISLDLSGSGNLMFDMGQMYVPFGVFETNLVSDPLTLEIGEINESAVQVRYETGGLYGSLYTFNGDTQTNQDVVENYGFNLGYAQENLDLNLSYISSIGDADGFDAAGLGLDNADYVSAIGLSGVYSSGPVTMIAEYIKTAQFDQANIAFENAGAEISALNAELAYALSDNVTIAAAYQATEEADVLGLAESRIAMAVSTTIYDGAGLAIEYAKDSAYDESDSSTLTIQLAAEF